MAIATRCTSRIAKAAIRSPRGLRELSSSPILASGHSRWSKIKHDKFKEDAVRSKERSRWAHNLQDAVKKSGGDDSNAEVITLVTQAKKAGLPKDVIERAIAKGKGVSPSGIALETLILEAMLPPSVSLMIECQTDNKNRTLGELRLLLKDAGGTVTPTSHLFEKRGRIVLESEGKVNEEEVMETVLEAGALDLELEQDERSLVVYTEPTQTASVAQTLAASLGFQLKTYEIIWMARPESLVRIDGASADTHSSFDKTI
ncbi:MAG: hypothetical protein Q9207_006882, partial [Kuettlingeria erythrocarpa]